MTPKPRLLLDEMLTGDIAARLRANEHDVTATVDDPELIGTPDEDLLAHASDQDRCLVTANVGDFAAISRLWVGQGREHGGLIYIVNRVFPSDRSFVGAVVTALGAVIADGQVPSPGAETYLRRELR